MDEGPREVKMIFELLNSAAEAMLIVDADGKILWNNTKAEKLFGYGEKELTTQSVDILVPSELKKRHAEKREAFLRMPRNRPMGAGIELRARRKNGSEFPVEVSLSHSGEGEEVRVMALVTDASNRRIVEEDARRREEKCREVVENVLEQEQSAVFLLDRDLEVAWTSSGAQELFDLLPLEATGRPFGLILSHAVAAKLEEGEAFSREVMRSYAEGRHLSGVLLHLSAAGQPRLLEYGSQPIKRGRYAGGRVERFDLLTVLPAAGEAEEFDRQRLDQLEEEFRTLKRLSGPLPTPVSSRMLDIPPVREALPDVFSALCGAYESLLEQAMEMRMYKVEHDLSGPLRSLAEKLGSIKAGPRDALDIHRDVLRRKEIKEGNPKLRSYVEEGYLLLVELLGDLLSIYRNHAFSRMGHQDKTTPGG